VFAGTSFREKGVEGVVATADGFVGRHLSVRLDAVFEAVKLPTGVTHLDSGLADMDGDDFSHFFLGFLFL
jgi:hypothetical protein